MRLATRLERLAPLVPLLGILVGTLAGCGAAPLATGNALDQALTACHEHLDTLPTPPEDPVAHCLEVVR